MGLQQAGRRGIAISCEGLQPDSVEELNRTLRATGCSNRVEAYF